MKTCSDSYTIQEKMAKLKASGQGMVVCRICKGPHWTKQCPYKDTLGVALDVQQGKSHNVLVISRINLLGILTSSSLLVLLHSCPISVKTTKV